MDQVKSADDELNIVLGVLIISMKTHFAVLQPINSSSQPIADCFFNPSSVAVSIKRIQRLSRCVEWDMAAWDSLRAALGWYKVHQNAPGAGAGVRCLVVVYAGRRVFENKMRSPCHPSP
jgi:hypothetical protein